MAEISDSPNRREISTDTADAAAANHFAAVAPSDNTVTLIIFIAPAMTTV